MNKYTKFIASFFIFFGIYLPAIIETKSSSSRSSGYGSSSSSSRSSAFSTYTKNLKLQTPPRPQSPASSVSPSHQYPLYNPYHSSPHVIYVDNPRPATSSTSSQNSVAMLPVPVSEPKSNNEKIELTDFEYLMNGSLIAVGSLTTAAILATLYKAYQAKYPVKKVKKQAAPKVSTVLSEKPVENTVQAAPSKNNEEVSQEEVSKKNDSYYDYFKGMIASLWKSK